MGLELATLPKFAFNHACFAMSFRTADLLSYSKLLLLKDFTTGFLRVDKKKASNGVERKILLAVSTKQYMFRINISQAGTISGKAM